MSSLDALPADQRAAVQLLLKQGQTYEQLADLLGIDAGGVRTRAHAALDTLGPEPGGGLDAATRAEVADYLLGQQSVSEREGTRQTLAGSDDARAWAGEVADALRPLAGDALPEIPAGGGPAVRDEPTREEPAVGDEPSVRDEPPVREETRAREEVARAEPDEEPAAFEEAGDEPAAFDFPRRDRGPRRRRERPERDEGDEAAPAKREAGARVPSSRLGGALLLAGVGIVIAVVIILLVNGGGDDDEKASTVSRTAPTQTSTTAQTPTAQINLTSASGNSRQVGLAQVFQQGNRRALIVAGQGLRPGAYALWLYNDDDDAQLLGFVPQRVGEDGRFATQGELPNDAEKFDELVVTRERVTRRTRNPPKNPGTVVLRGDLKVD